MFYTIIKTPLKKLLQAEAEPAATTSTTLLERTI
jgi:hypothetical protein